MASSLGVGVPPEITAEWTVHAQLTLSHQGSSASCDKLKSEGGSAESNPAASNTNSNDGGGGAGAGESPAPSSQRPPVKVIYKFSTPRGSDGATVSGNYFPVDGGGVTLKQDGAAIFTATDQPKTSSASVDQSKQSTNEDGSKPVPAEQNLPKPSDPVPNFLASPQTLTTAMTSQLFPQCTSTCSIVLTADLLPAAGRGEPFISVNKCASTSNVFNTADKFTCFPEKASNGSKIYEARDVSCQTSDIELTKDKTVQTSRDDLRSLPRRAAEALMSPVTARREEKYGSLTRISPISPADILSPSNTLQSQRSSVKDSKKKPRTVHIDVYCTGSDAESSSSADSSSRSASLSSASGSRFDTSHLMDIKSNSNVTHPTVFESEEMKLRHKRAGKHDVPRRLVQQTVVDQSTLSTVGGSVKRSGSHNRRSVKRSSTKDEINESKQMLFNKILGEPKEAETFANLEYLERDPSDDNISSNYPFSNRSTKRDVTGSSLSSALASAGFDDIGDLDESASGIVNLNRSGTVMTHSDSFEYANSEDRYRIHQMERVWGDQTWKSPSVERKLLEIHNPKFLRRSESENNLSESDHSFVYDSPSRPNESIHSDSSPSTVKSNSNRAPSNVNASKRILQHALLNANGSSTFPPRTLSPVEGYTSEYLALARRFGSLITGKRKPGVHMGPVRNPECQCEHCRRWMLQRDDNVRERAMSVDDAPSSIVDMRRKLHLRNYAVLQ